MVGDRFEGHDLEVVQKHIAEAVDRARTGGGPTFVEILTYRFRGHSMSDPAKYRSRTELEQKKQQDPIAVVRERLLGLDVDENTLDDIDLEVDEEIDAAVRFADESAPCTRRRDDEHRACSGERLLRELRYREALREAMLEEMKRDELVFPHGRRSGSLPGGLQGVRGICSTSLESGRVIDTPIAEAGFAGVGIGAAMAGLRPIIEFMTWNFSFVAFDQIISNAAKVHQMSAGAIQVPIVFRGPNGAAKQVASQHSHSCAPFSHAYPWSLRHSAEHPT